MSGADPLSYDAALEEYQRQADALFQALRSGADEARWRFKWEHPRFRGKSVGEVDAATLDLADAQRLDSPQPKDTTNAITAINEPLARNWAIACLLSMQRGRRGQIIASVPASPGAS